MSAERRSLISEMVLLAMALSERTVRVHPLTKVRENLLSRSITVQRLQPGPFFGLSVTDKRNYDVGENRTVAVEAFAGNGNVSVLKQVRFDDGLEGGFAGLYHAFRPPCESCRSVSMRLNFDRINDLTLHVF